MLAPGRPRLPHGPDGQARYRNRRHVSRTNRPHHERDPTPARHTRPDLNVVSHTNTSLVHVTTNPPGRSTPQPLPATTHLLIITQYSWSTSRDDHPLRDLGPGHRRLRPARHTLSAGQDSAPTMTRHPVRHAHTRRRDNALRGVRCVGIRPLQGHPHPQPAARHGLPPPHSRPVIATVRTDRNRAAECAGPLNGGRGLPSGVESTRRNPGLRDQG